MQDAAAVLLRLPARLRVQKLQIPSHGGLDIGQISDKHDRTISKSHEYHLVANIQVMLVVFPEVEEDTSLTLQTGRKAQ